MPQKVSFVILLAILLAIAFLFFKVMANFLLPIFLALLLVVMFGPLHRWFVAKCGGRQRVAAGLTTLSILVICLLPLAVIITQAAYEAVRIYAQVSAGEIPLPDADREIAKLNAQFGLRLSDEYIQQTIQEKVREWLGPLVLSTTRYAGATLLGFGIMVISLYYFLADGPGMIRTLMRLSPLDDHYEDQLIDQFENISRAVVVASLLSAAVQGILGGVGYYLVGLDSVFLLIMLTMLLALVPFVGAAAVWVPVCLWIGFYEKNMTTAVILALYSGLIVSMADNVIKPFILHGRSSLHPLLALLSVLGGVQALGPIGIFVGPMVVVFLQTLLNMLHTELNRIDDEDAASESDSEDASGGDAEAAEPVAEAAE